MNEYELKEAAQLLDKKIEYIDKIIDITNKQKKAIKKEDIELLEVYTNQRQDIINEVDKLDAILKEETREQDNNDLLGNKLRELSLSLTTLKNMDNENKKLLEEKMNDIKSKIQEVKQGQKMAKGYGMDFYNNMGSFFIDQKN
ncbi:flagella synthesis protein FlgN [Gottschalkia purinilytica]|uniref:Flagella synthesis protein FlgN n=1 Tax=Gottschalkia purinilytica TaxID=1503 RepID=A0A0L0WDT2_GOTPU|nr:flagellar protein FlgN [Gottschalkia purinilytica]KNF09637.1 flagella synthesis protein FlgN [Gottschalkia purinilytica]